MCVHSHMCKYMAVYTQSERKRNRPGSSKMLAVESFGLQHFRAAIYNKFPEHQLLELKNGVNVNLGERKELDK